MTPYKINGEIWDPPFRKYNFKFGFEYCWEIELQLKPHAAPPAVIGGAQRLGWTAWAGKAMHDRPVTGMIFEPEHGLTH